MPIYEDVLGNRYEQDETGKKKFLPKVSSRGAVSPSAQGPNSSITNVPDSKITRGVGLTPKDITASPEGSIQPITIPSTAALGEVLPIGGSWLGGSLAGAGVAAAAPETGGGSLAAGPAAIMGGEALGYTAGKKVQGWLQDASPYLFGPNQNQSFIDTLREAGINAGVGAGTKGVVSALKATPGKAVSLATQYGEGADPEVRAFMREHPEMPVRPSDVTGNAALRMAEKVAGGPAQKEIGNIQDRITQAALNKDFGAIAHASDVAETIHNDIREGHKVLQGQLRTHIGNVEKIAEENQTGIRGATTTKTTTSPILDENGKPIQSTQKIKGKDYVLTAPVSIDNTRKYARYALGKIGESAADSSAQASAYEQISKSNPTLYKQLETYAAGKGPINYTNAKNLYISLADAASDYKKYTANDLQTFAKVRDSLGNDIKASMQGTNNTAGWKDGKAAADEWQQWVDKRQKAGELYSKADWIKSITDSSDVKANVAQHINQTSASIDQAIKASANPARTYQNLRSAMLSDYLPSVAGNDISKLGDMLDAKANTGALDRLFSGPEKARLKQMAKVGKQLAKNTDPGYFVHYRKGMLALNLADAAYGAATGRDTSTTAEHALGGMALMMTPGILMNMALKNPEMPAKLLAASEGKLSQSARAGIKTEILRGMVGMGQVMLEGPQGRTYPAKVDKNGKITFLPGPVKTDEQVQ